MDVALEGRDFRYEVMAALDELRRDLSALYSRREPDFVSPASNMRLAITVADPQATPEYPAQPANTFPIAFLTAAAFTEAAGEQSITGTQYNQANGVPDAKGINLTGAYLPQGTYVRVLEEHGRSWIEQSLGSRQPVRFRVTEDFALGGSGAAALLMRSGSGYATGATITVHDWLNTQNTAIKTGAFLGRIGYEGIAVYREAGTPDKYDIVWMEHKAQWITFKLLAKITNQDEPINAEYQFAIGDTTHGFSQGRDPNDSANLQPVYDVTGAFFGAPVGAVGIAKWNDVLLRYEIVICQMPVMRATANLVENMCNPTAVAIENFAPVVEGLFMLTPDPAPTSVLNPCKHYGLAGSFIKIERDLQADEWTIYDVEKQPRRLAGPVETSSNGISQKIYDCAVEICSEGIVTNPGDEYTPPVVEPLENLIGELIECDEDVPYTPGGGGGGTDPPDSTDVTSEYFGDDFDLASDPKWEADAGWTSDASYAMTAGTGRGIGIERLTGCGGSGLSNVCTRNATLTVEIGPEGGFLEYSMGKGPACVCGSNEISQLNILINGVNEFHRFCGSVGGSSTDWDTRGPIALEPGVNVITFQYQDGYETAPTATGVAFMISDVTVWGEVTP